MANEFKITGDTLEAGSNFAATNYIIGDEVSVEVTGTDSASPTPFEKTKTFTITIGGDFGEDFGDGFG